MNNRQLIIWALAIVLAWCCSTVWAAKQPEVIPLWNETDESNTANNCAVAVTVTVAGPTPNNRLYPGFPNGVSA